MRILKSILIVVVILAIILIVIYIGREWINSLVDLISTFKK